MADQTNYNIIDLELASLTPLFPLSQARDTSIVVKPFILVVSDFEFLILSWTGTSTIGMFINSDGDPVRGTMEWQTHPQAVCTSFIRKSSVAYLSITKQVLITHTLPRSCRTTQYKYTASKSSRLFKRYLLLRHLHPQQYLGEDERGAE